MDTAAAALLTPRSPSSSSCACSSPSASFSFSPRRSSFPDLDPASSSLWANPRPFTISPLQPPPFRRPRPRPIDVSNYATSAEPRTATPRWTPSPPRTHYDLLGVSPASSPTQIRSAYRKLALHHHPDVSPLHQLDSATKFFAEINEAYAVLTDPKEKACYDLKLALESQAPTAAMVPASPMEYQGDALSHRQYTDASTGRVYSSINSFYREWRRAKTPGCL